MRVGLSCDCGVEAEWSGRMFEVHLHADVSSQIRGLFGTGTDPQQVTQHQLVGEIRWGWHVKSLWPV